VLLSATKIPTMMSGEMWADKGTRRRSFNYLRFIRFGNWLPCPESSGFRSYNFAPYPFGQFTFIGTIKYTIFWRDLQRTGRFWSLRRILLLLCNRSDIMIP